ncbi:MAG: ABC transporter ATP-binding protein [Asgard group archaeon]|nr:ABC transporter ATP-binding protein [Asgard group archaeon]
MKHNYLKKKANPLLQVRNLETHIIDKDDRVHIIVDKISFDLREGEVLGIIGPSGAGKTILALSLLKLIQRPGKIIGGSVIYKDLELLSTSDEILDKIRGKDIALVMQNTGTGFDPIRDMTFTTSEPLREHSNEKIPKTDLQLLVIDQLGKVAIRKPSKTAEKFRHQISGGEGQRVKIASALFNNPKILIAEEPVANLDTTIMGEILDLLIEVKNNFSVSMIVISHNLGVIAQLSDRVMMMYAGKIIEVADVETMFYSPRHPYTQGLFYATPSIVSKKKLKTIPGNVPNPVNLPKGCHFHPRCKYVIEKCKKMEPPLVEYEQNHLVACWRMNEIPDFEIQE